MSWASTNAKQVLGDTEKVMVVDAAVVDVARFMLEKLHERNELFQEEIVHEISQNFGEKFVYLNENGNLAIERNVLALFRELSPNVVWDRGGRYWRFRSSDDGKSRII